jgi:hypothetical protein
MNSKDELQELYTLKMFIESQSFQRYLLQPLKDEIKKLRYAYDCQSLRELSTVKGKSQGLKFIIRLIKNIETRIKDLEIQDNPKL